MEITYHLGPDHIKQLHNLYQHEWWTKGRTLEDTTKCVAGSQVCIGILSEQQLVGFLRVLSDFTFKAIIFDVIVERTHRGQGLGNQLIELAKTHPQLRDVKHFELYGLPEMHGFYTKHGFSTEVGNLVLMRNDRS